MSVMLTANNRRPRVIWDELEAGLGSGAQFRVLLHLILKPEEAYTKYSLVKATGLRITAVTQQLERLSELGWIKKHESSLQKRELPEVAKVISRLAVLNQTKTYLVWKNTTSLS